MKKTDLARLKALAEKIAARCPPPMPCSFKWCHNPLYVDGKRACGYKQLFLNGQRYSAVLAIDVTEPYLVARDTLVHEWAHLLSWTPAHDAGAFGPHGPEWGVAYARAYCASVDEHFH